MKLTNRKGSPMFGLGKTGVFRQGDVLLVKVAELPKKAKDITPEGDIVLAYGEVTGHAHRLALPPVLENMQVAGVGKDKQLTVKKPVRLWDAGAERFIQVLEKTSLTHEEHSQIPLDPGFYKVVQQREYDPEAERLARQVAD